MTSILLELKAAKSYDRILKKNGDEIQEAFFANYLTALLMIRLKDLRSIKGLLKIKAKKSLKFSTKLHDVNYWASCVFFQHFDDKLEKLIGKKLLSSMKITMQNAMEEKVVDLLQALKMPEDQIPWKRTCDVLEFLSKGLKFRSKYVLKILKALQEWDSASESEKSQLIAKCFKYLYQVDQDSRYFVRLKELSEKISIPKSDAKIVKVTKLTEDEAATVAGNIGSGESSSLFGAQVLSRIKPQSNSSEKMTQIGNTKLFRMNGSIIRKKTRKFKPSFFKAPKD